jgi:hypothetical protein
MRQLPRRPSGKKYGAIGNEALGGTPERFTAFIAKESAKWAAVAKHVGAKLDWPGSNPMTDR